MVTTFILDSSSILTVFAINESFLILPPLCLPPPVALEIDWKDQLKPQHNQILFQN
jgi:hypothetical protein